MLVFLIAIADLPRGRLGGVATAGLASHSGVFDHTASGQLDRALSSYGVIAWGTITARDLGAVDWCTGRIAESDFPAIKYIPVLSVYL